MVGFIYSAHGGVPQFWPHPAFITTCGQLYDYLSDWLQANNGRELTDLVSVRHEELLDCMNAGCIYSKSRKSVASDLLQMSYEFMRLEGSHGGEIACLFVFACYQKLLTLRSLTAVEIAMIGAHVTSLDSARVVVTPTAVRVLASGIDVPFDTLPRFTVEEIEFAD